MFPHDSPPTTTTQRTCMNTTQEKGKKQYFWPRLWWAWVKVDFKHSCCTCSAKQFRSYGDQFVCLSHTGCQNFVTSSVHSAINDHKVRANGNRSKKSWGLIRKGNRCAHYKPPWACGGYVKTSINSTLFTSGAVISVKKKFITFKIPRTLTQ